MFSSSSLISVLFVTLFYCLIDIQCRFHHHHHHRFSLFHHHYHRRYHHRHRHHWRLHHRQLLRRLILRRILHHRRHYLSQHHDNQYREQEDSESEKTAPQIESHTFGSANPNLTSDASIGQGHAHAYTGGHALVRVYDTHSFSHVVDSSGKHGSATFVHKVGNKVYKFSHNWRKK